MSQTASAVNYEKIIETKGVGKEFNGVWVLNDIEFDLKPGEIHSLVGENGAGKSTFIKILSGVYKPSSGTLSINGQPTVLQNVKHSETLGIRTVHQELNLVPFSQCTKIFLLARKKTEDFRYRCNEGQRNEKYGQEVIEKLGVELDVNRPVHLLNAAMQRIVEISKVLIHRPKVMIFDEPTTSSARRKGPSCWK